MLVVSRRGMSDSDHGLFEQTRIKCFRRVRRSSWKADRLTLLAAKCDVDTENRGDVRHRAVSDPYD
jgi:hypothetical protein